MDRGWWWPRRDSNPRFRLERPASWAVLDDGAMDASVILRTAPEHSDCFCRAPLRKRGARSEVAVAGRGAFGLSGSAGQLGGEPFLVEVFLAHPQIQVDNRAERGEQRKAQQVGNLPREVGGKIFTCA